MYNTYMPNKTISLPEDVAPIIERLDKPFSQWVADQLRRYQAESVESFQKQLELDASLASTEEKLTSRDAVAIGRRMERSAPW